jgi:hypothetical protein
MRSPASHNTTVSNAQSSSSRSVSFSYACAQVTTTRYYETDSALRSHWKSKVHKRRCKALKEPAYTIEESERAAGLGKDNGRAVAVAAESDNSMSQ